MKPQPTPLSRPNGEFVPIRIARSFLAVLGRVVPAHAVRTGSVRRVVAILALLGVVSGASAQTPLVSGSEHRGILSSPGQQDSWTFTGREGEWLVVRLGKVRADDTFSPLVQLLGPDGKTVSIGNDPLSAWAWGLAPASGRYTVVVQSAEGVGGEYRLSLALATVEPVISPGDEGGPLRNGEVANGAILPGDLDLWSFEARQGQRILLDCGRVTERETLYPALRVVDPTGRADVAVASSTHWARIVFDAPLAGRYLVVVDSVGSGSGAYRLSLGRGGESVLVSPDDEGGGLPGLPFVDGNLVPGDLDVWSFAACTGHAFRIATERIGGDPDFAPRFAMMNPAGGVLDNAGPEITLESVRIPTNGVYTVVVWSEARAGGSIPSGSYRLHVGGLRLSPRLGLRQHRDGTILDAAGGPPLGMVRILASPDALLPIGSWQQVLDARYNETGDLSLPWVQPGTAPLPPYFLRAVSLSP